VLAATSDAPCSDEGPATIAGPPAPRYPGRRARGHQATATVLPIAIALIGSYKLRENSVRCTVAAEALRGERAKDLTRTTPAYLRIPGEDALNSFVERIESLALSEVEEWRKQMVQQTNEPRAGQRGTQ